jgi:hypothetical protein
VRSAISPLGKRILKHLSITMTIVTHILKENVSIVVSGSILRVHSLDFVATDVIAIITNLKGNRRSHTIVLSVEPHVGGLPATRRAVKIN